MCLLESGQGRRHGHVASELRCVVRAGEALDGDRGPGSAHCRSRGKARMRERRDGGVGWRRLLRGSSGGGATRSGDGGFDFPVAGLALFFVGGCVAFGLAFSLACLLARCLTRYLAHLLCRLRLRRLRRLLLRLRLRFPRPPPLQPRPQLLLRSLLPRRSRRPSATIPLPRVGPREQTPLPLRGRPSRRRRCPHRVRRVHRVRRRTGCDGAAQPRHGGQGHPARGRRGGVGGELLRVFLGRV